MGVFQCSFATTIKSYVLFICRSVCFKRWLDDRQNHAKNRINRSRWLLPIWFHRGGLHAENVTEAFIPLVLSYHSQYTPYVSHSDKLFNPSGEWRENWFCHHHASCYDCFLASHSVFSPWNVRWGSNPWNKFAGHSGHCFLGPVCQYFRPEGVFCRRQSTRLGTKRVLRVQEKEKRSASTRI